MGNSQSSVNIILDRSQPSIYYTGELVKGLVQVVLSERTEDLNCIYLTLTGDAAYTRTRETRIMNGQKENFIDRYDVRLLNKKVVLSSPIRIAQGDDFFGNEPNNGANGAIGPGKYHFPFSIRLPDVLPPTLHPEDCPYVRYALEVSERSELVRTNFFLICNSNRSSLKNVGTFHTSRVNVRSASTRK